MANARLSKDKRALVLAALAEGTPINAVCRMFKTGKHAVLRVIEECGEAMNAYMRANFRDLPCQRIELDEQWQYVGIHGQRMAVKEVDRGDFWLWGAVDADTKLVFSHFLGKRTRVDCEDFVGDVRNRVRGHVQIATDNLGHYPYAIRLAFGYEGYSYGTETKIFGEPEGWQPSEEGRTKKNGVPQIASATRKAIIGSPDLGSLTTSHIERVWLSVRQENTRFTRLTLGYSKDLRMHKLAIALHFGIYNFCRKHKSLGGQTPAQAAGVEEERWTLERVIEMTDAYFAKKEEAAFERAFARAGYNS
jgi:IS1 family transposase